MTDSIVAETKPGLREPTIETLSYGAIIRDASTASHSREPSPSSPLLRRLPSSRRPSVSASVTSLAKRNTVFFLAVVIGCTILVDIGANMPLAPGQRIMESIICRTSYREHDPRQIGLDGEVEEKLCKIPSVQKDLANLRGWLNAIEVLPGLVLTVPYGILADRIGRRPVLLMAISGHIAFMAFNAAVCWFYDTFPIYLVLVGPLIQVFGGGAATMISTITAAIADVISPQQRASAFFQAAAATQVANLIAYPLSAVTMARTPWLSTAISFGFLFVAALLMLLLPETIQRDMTSSGEALADDSTEEISDTSAKGASLAGKLKSYCTQAYRESDSFLTRGPIATILPIFLFASIIGTVITFQIQYASDKFEWTMAHASILPTIESATKLLLLVVALPLVSHYLNHILRLPPLRTDLLLTRLSLAITVLGLFLIGFAPSTTFLMVSQVIYSLGGGQFSSARSLISLLSPKDKVGRAFAVVATLQMVGAAVAGPIFAGLYSLGLSLGPFWSGLPFILAAVAMMAGGLPIFIFDVTAQGKAGEARMGIVMERERHEDEESGTSSDEENGAEEPLIRAER